MKSVQQAGFLGFLRSLSGPDASVTAAAHAGSPAKQPLLLKSDSCYDMNDIHTEGAAGWESEAA